MDEITSNIAVLAAKDKKSDAQIAALTQINASAEHGMTPTKFQETFGKQYSNPAR
ncbi:MAG: hypothetical protein LBG89_03205 [Rickettsiales bacterium]|nr:hypothetical protein [Rickettsiales bacterium]